MSVLQYARLPRADSPFAMVETWAQGEIGDLGANVFSARVNTGIDEMLEQFSNDYLTANPVRR